MIRVTENRFEPPENGRELFSYLFDQVFMILTIIIYDETHDGIF